MLLQGYPPSRQIQRQEFRVGEIAFLHAHYVLKDMLQATESANGRLVSLSGIPPEPFRSPAL